MKIAIERERDFSWTLRREDDEGRTALIERGVAAGDITVKLQPTIEKIMEDDTARTASIAALQQVVAMTTLPGSVREKAMAELRALQPTQII